MISSFSQEQFQQFYEFSGGGGGGGGDNRKVPSCPSPSATYTNSDDGPFIMVLHYLTCIDNVFFSSSV